MHMYSKNHIFTDMRFSPDNTKDSFIAKFDQNRWSHFEDNDEKHPKRAKIGVFPNFGGSKISKS